MLPVQNQSILIVKAIGIRLSSEQKEEAIKFLKNNPDIFRGRSAYDLGWK